MATPPDRPTPGHSNGNCPRPAQALWRLAGRYLKHKLPGTLHNVLLVYCPGMPPFAKYLEEGEPWVWKKTPEDWPPGQELRLDGTPMGDRLAVRPATDDAIWGGFLAGFKEKPGVNIGDKTTSEVGQVETDVTVEMFEMLTFFGTLPPPEFRKIDFNHPPDFFHRSLGRTLDLSARLPMRCLIVMGHLENSELPLPLTADGKTPPADDHSWTVVRLILPIEP